MSAMHNAKILRLQIAVKGACELGYSVASAATEAGYYTMLTVGDYSFGAMRQTDGDVYYMFGSGGSYGYPASASDCAVLVNKTYSAANMSVDYYYFGLQAVDNPATALVVSHL